MKPPITPEHKEFVTFCNSLRCPLCGSQLDGNIHPKLARLYCASNNAEYSDVWVPDSKLPKIEKINYWYAQYQYEISMVRHDDKNYRTVVSKINLDNLPVYRNREKIFEMYGTRMMFFRKRMEENAFIKKLKLYNVFS
jgi:hypothetical protein